MKKLAKINTGLLTRNFALAKLASQLGKDFLFSNKDSFSQKFGNYLEKRMVPLTDELSQLKGSFLKAGQLLSLYGKELLPPEVENLLENLQSQSSFLDWSQISKQIPQDLINDLDIHKTPMAAASIGQVHKAIDENGQEYALKIQYKNIEKVIDLDLKALRVLVNFSKIIPKNYNLDLIFSEIREMLLQEMNYQKEMDFTEKYRKLAGDQYIVPKIYRNYSGPRHICSEFIYGESISEAISNLDLNERNKLGKEFFLLFFKEVFEWKLIQSDAHLGNFLIRDKKWALLDFGATKEISGELSGDYQQIIKALAHRNKKSLWDILEKHEFINFSKSSEELLWDYFLLISEPFVQRDYDWGNSKITSQAMNMGKKLSKEVKLNYLPHQTIFIDRKIGGLYFMLKSLKANGDLIPWEYLE